MTRDVVVLSAVRTGIGRFGGGLSNVPLTVLASTVTRAAVQRSSVEPQAVGHVVFGNVIHTDPADMYLARVAALQAALPVGTPAFGVNRLCGSGLQAIISAAQAVAGGDAEIAVAGGAESMSRAPHWLTRQRWGARMGDTTAVDILLGALTDPFDSVHMGVTAENVARDWGISRADQDALAVQSHARAAKATADGRFRDQIVPVPGGKGTSTFAADEHIRDGVTLSDLARLRPVFAEGGSVTAGNASGVNDAAAAVVLASSDEAARRGLTPMGRLVAYSQVGVEPRHMGIGPVPAIRTALARAELTIDDIDLFEVNEAFAAQALAVSRDLGLPADRTNPNGSGIGLGHPVGATGTILTVKALHELARTGGRYAVVSLCIGGGQGIAAVFERTPR
jgi:acetyl-CoA C-acetyltransferase